MLNLSSLLLFSENAKALSDFYGKILQKQPEWAQGDWTGYQIGSGSIAIGPHDKVHGKNSNPDRIIFNLDTDNVQEEFNRIKELGVEVIAEPYHPGEEPEMWIATFADVDGNYFQITTPWKADQ
ncbi:hypothetical protein A2690_04990 [Candidatus Roizmanbacteria bacterium RIFCSPHIGHO2_01_FULL_39_12b]|uniref:VOC domain-containing protein n=1 Tax=Candidatus Roizmanbacteria bacterium RIFCSPHIGHO2_01_FULL_39_12b TaxID=1802030 RepID=A0A1F7GDN1_9BACT|nr:MAG: hypothetical protein A2690_04990 [Candidatus Roizmanbacteria bacterium RIFCSPHIGHO2_01_FULL_39_12b]OGK46522.1 MAG: hypothetical protein A3B46_01105 [Candidatus Roizmanbacteria bacterium RIFCSPLOWO2_01_FULL_39_19]